MAESDTSLNVDAVAMRYLDGTGRDVQTYVSTLQEAKAMKG